ncbi:unnamed protein product [Prorocentrum cordatum]|uniref:CSD domain-containing protein n=1 Tax=Prorocentrum cordatum TaxID=2364126 RepID=A0ABN9SEE1_9DINO|nr:unnamed protein product [Polarella glacialis]
MAAAQATNTVGAPAREVGMAAAQADEGLFEGLADGQADGVGCFGQLSDSGRYARMVALQQQMGLVAHVPADVAARAERPGGSTPKGFYEATPLDPKKRIRGTVLSWDSDRCFGFIKAVECKKAYGKDAFFHQSELVDSERPGIKASVTQKFDIDEGEEVIFNVELDKGKPRAREVEFLRKELRERVSQLARSENADLLKSKKLRQIETQGKMTGHYR